MTSARSDWRRRCWGSSSSGCFRPLADGSEVPASAVRIAPPTLDPRIPRVHLQVAAAAAHPDPEGKLVEHRDRIVRRVVHALEETRDPDALVWAYFDEDRDAVIEATRQTLEATREEVSTEKVAALVDRELIDGLRFPVGRSRSLAASLYIHRGRAALGAALVTISSLLALLLL